ncbi:hypothetical protein IFR05_005490 [Cadophora sp. M221]|nr:hypothetical protein IFR05_005490 [Cadophora sp. M221]
MPPPSPYKGIHQIPTNALEHIQCLSRFSSIEVYQWMELWKSSKARWEDDIDLDGNYDLGLVTDLKTEYTARDHKADEMIKSRPNHQLKPSISKPAFLGLSTSQQPEQQRYPEKSANPPTGKQSPKGSPEIYACLFCQKTFGRKGDWKRHEGTLHELQREWRCAEPACNRKFLARNKFRRHHESDHGCVDCRHDSDPTVMVVLRTASAWGCGFCVAVLMTWDERVDHIGNHFETGWKRLDWDFSTVVKSLLLQPGVCDAWESLLLQMHGQSAANWPLFEWHADSCRELLRQLRSSKTLNLAQEMTGVVHLAYKLGVSSPSQAQPYIFPPLPGTYQENLLDQGASPNAASPETESVETIQMAQTSPTKAIEDQMNSASSLAAAIDMQTSAQAPLPEDYDFDEYLSAVKDYTTPCPENFQPTAWGMWPEPLDPFVLQ